MRSETAAFNLGLIAPALLALVQAPAAGEAAIVAQSLSSGDTAAAVIQTTPGERSPALEIDSGPGYVIVRQRGSRGHAVIYQGTAPRYEK